jgi:hypothetical protein
VQAELAKAQINQSLVEQYKASIEAALSAVEIYKARIAGIQVKAEIEKTKIEAYGEQVRAMCREDQRVHRRRRGLPGQPRSGEHQAEGLPEPGRSIQRARGRRGEAGRYPHRQLPGKLDGWLAQWDGYKATIAGEASKAQAVSSYNQSLSAEYQSEVAAVTSFNETLTKQWQAVIDEAFRVTDIGVNAAKANAELYMTTRSLATRCRQGRGTGVSSARRRGAQRDQLVTVDQYLYQQQLRHEFLDGVQQLKQLEQFEQHERQHELQLLGQHLGGSDELGLLARS